VHHLKQPSIAQPDPGKAQGKVQGGRFPGRPSPPRVLPTTVLSCPSLRRGAPPCCDNSQP
jgi:hypothetical protein